MELIKQSCFVNTREYLLDKDINVLEKYTVKELIYNNEKKLRNRLLKVVSMKSERKRSCHCNSLFEESFLHFFFFYRKYECLETVIIISSSHSILS